jgi:hypothetical protein
MATKNEKSGYAMYEKTENVLMKKKELKAGMKKLAKKPAAKKMVMKKMGKMK